MKTTIALLVMTIAPMLAGCAAGNGNSCCGGGFGNGLDQSNSLQLMQMGLDMMSRTR
jgi:hypothetical protein